MRRLLLVITCILIIINGNAQVPNYVPTNGLVGWWPFNGNANDLSGNGNNGTVNGATLSTDNLGNANSAYSFNGSGQFIQVPHSSSLTFNTNQISISLWINIAAYTATNGFSKIAISKQTGDGNTQSGFNLYYVNTYHGLLIKNGSGGNFGGAGNSQPVSLNTWKHLVYTWDGSYGRFYENGVLVNISAQTVAAIGANTMALLFGKANWTNINAEPFNGKMDDIAMYNRALTACEIGQLYNRQLSTLAVSGGSDIVTCEGEFITLAGSGATTFSWDNGVNNNVPFVPNVGNTTFTVIGTDNFGCTAQDQVVVQVNGNTSSNVSEVACNSYTAPDGQVYTSDGIYSAIIPNSTGCDSTITINLTVNQPSVSFISEHSCGNYTAPDGQTYSNSGTYIATISNQAGCDSTITIDLSVTDIDNSVTVDGLLLSANQLVAGYQWLDCDNGNQEMNGEFNQHFEVTQNGQYAVEITFDGCVDTSECILIDYVGLESINESNFSFYSCAETLYIIYEQLPVNSSVNILDLQGKIVLHSAINPQLDISLLNNGFYFLQILNNSEVILKEKFMIYE